MKPVSAGKIPAALKELKQWVLWKSVVRDNDKPTKLPYQVNDQLAKSNDAKTWNTFDAVYDRYQFGGYDGIGIVFAEGGGMCGVDLDGCRNPQTGEVAPWARLIIEKFATYTEVSPSETGVKLFCLGTSPLDGGKKREVANAERLSDKNPAIEVYDKLRYFAVTGWRCKSSNAVEQRQEKLDWLKNLYWPPKAEQPFTPSPSTSVLDRARKYVAKLPPAISGQDGSGRTFHVACVLACGFGLDEGEVLTVLREYNQTCNPPWSEKELLHKAKSAAKQGGERNYLRDTSPEQWRRIVVPTYREPSPQREVKVVTLDQAANGYLSKLESGEETLISTGIAELDHAVEGGLAFGEMVVIAALPSHGKSMIALQLVHEWTRQGMPCFVDSEEMTVQNLGKRALQWITSVPKSDWSGDLAMVRTDLGQYQALRAPCYIAESIGDTNAVVAKIDEMVEQHGVKCVVVDYTQYLTSAGKSKYEQVSATSVALKKCATRNNIILVALVQMNRDIEKRDKFLPKLSDIRDSAQIGQDADVILFVCWPWKIKSETDKQEYWFFISKNRNRDIKMPAVRCKFYGDRQMVVAAPPPKPKNYTDEFDEYNNRD